MTPSQRRHITEKVIRQLAIPNLPQDIALILPSLPQFPHPLAAMPIPEPESVRYRNAAAAVPVAAEAAVKPLVESITIPDFGRYARAKRSRHIHDLMRNGLNY